MAEGAQQVETKETDTASSESGDDEAVEEEDARAAERWARVRGLVGPDSSSSSSDPESDTEASEAKSENDAEVSTFPSPKRFLQHIYTLRQLHWHSL